MRIIPRAYLKNYTDEQHIHHLCLNVLDKLIELHQVPYQGTELEKLGKGEGYCRRQVEGWDTRYQKVTPNVLILLLYAAAAKYIPTDSKTCDS